MDNATTEWIARMDADDISFPLRIEKQMSFLKENPEYKMVGTGFMYLTPFNHIFEEVFQNRFKSRKLSVEMLTGQFFKRRRFGDATVIFDRKVALSVGGYDTDFTMGDVPLWIRILQVANGYEIAEPLYLVSLSANSMTSTQIEGNRVRAKYFPDYYKKEPITGEWVSNIKEVRGKARLRWLIRKILNPEYSWERQQFWAKIALWELLANSRQTAELAINHMAQSGASADIVTHYRILSSLSTLQLKILKMRHYYNIRHRPDIEKTLESYLRDSLN